VLAFRADDGSNQANGYADTSGYVPVNSPDTVSDPMHWQPLRVPDGNGGLTVQKFLTPHWRGVTPFALASPSELLPPGPTRTTLLLLDQEITDTLTQSATLTDLSKMRAEYWADGPGSETPPGHWCLFAQAVSRARGYSLDQDSRLFFALANALLDSSVAAWSAKRAWDYVRPVTAVHVRKSNQLVLEWPTFSAARDEAGNSRRQGGIHFPDADHDGRALGESVGASAWARAQAYSDGTAP